MSLEQLLQIMRNAPARYHELEAKKKTALLTPEEEGEAAGYIAQPNNLRGQELIKKRHLANLGLYTITSKEDVELRAIQSADFCFPYDPRGHELHQKNILAREGFGEITQIEQEELRKLHAAAYSRRQATERQADLEFKMSIRSPDMEESSLTSNVAVNNTLTLSLIEAKLAALENCWFGNITSSMIDSVISEIPDKPLIIEIGELAAHKAQVGPSKLELLMLSQLSGIKLMDDTKREDGSLTVLESLKCLRDGIRTKRFLLAVKDAVNELEKTHDTIHVLDAGCGAVPILGLYAALCSPKVKVTSLELNPNSYRMAKEIIEHLGLSDRIKVMQADATKYTPETKPDLLISETMHSGLTQEMIVPIMTNLVPHVSDGGLILPKAVKVKAAIIPIEKYMRTTHFAFFYSKEHMYILPEWQQSLDYKPGDHLERIEFEIPTTDLKPGTYLAVVSSDVNLGNYSLGDFDSLISTPQIALDPQSDFKDPTPWGFTIKAEDVGNKSVYISYKPGDNSKGIAEYR